MIDFRQYLYIPPIVINDEWISTLISDIHSVDPFDIICKTPKFYDNSTM